MKWILRLTAILLLFIPRGASALDLSWSTGSTALAFTDATRCTLLVKADGSETALPGDWRLLWTAENCQIRPIPIQSGDSCPVGMALVSAIGHTTDAAGILGHELPVEYCTPAGSLVTSAQYVLDLPGGSRGKFEVVALDPTDPESTRVLVSPVAVFNGGVDDSFPPVLLRTHTEHHSTQFTLSAVGPGLGTAHDLSLAAPDATWQIPIAITNQSATSLTASASLAASVPTCLMITPTDGGAAIGEVPADPPAPALDPEAACSRIFIENVDPPNVIQPKDFAFVPGGWTPSGTWMFHLFYIRHNQYVPNTPTEKNLGHAVSNDLVNWTVVDTAAITVRPGRFDSQNVWAPSIVKRGLTYYMFYTGRDDALDQRIGLATSTDLMAWTQEDSVFDVEQVPWADAHPAIYSSQSQFRDSYVMEDPDSLGHWLMYFVTVPTAYSPGMVAGFAKSDGSQGFHFWRSATPLWPTLRPWTGATGRVESPDVLYRNGAWWLFTTNNHTGADSPSDTVYAVSNPNSPTDTTSANWSPGRALQKLVPSSEATAYNFWHATEHIDIGDVHYLAGFNDAQVGISYTTMLAASPPSLFSGDCPTTLGVDPIAGEIRMPRLIRLGPSPARSRVALRIELPARSHVVLSIYDVRGARVRTLVDEDLRAGVTELAWDGRTGAGRASGSGIYFANMWVRDSRSTVRVPLIR